MKRWQEGIFGEPLDRGVDVIYDTVGGYTYTEVTNAIASPGGRVLIVGFASGTMAKPDARDILFRDYSVSGALSAFRNNRKRDDTVAALSIMLRDGRIPPGHRDVLIR